MSIPRLGLLRYGAIHPKPKRLPRHLLPGQRQLQVHKSKRTSRLRFDRPNPQQLAGVNDFSPCVTSTESRPFRHGHSNQLFSCGSGAPPRSGSRGPSPKRSWPSAHGLARELFDAVQNIDLVQIQDGSLDRLAPGHALIFHHAVAAIVFAFFFATGGAEKQVLRKMPGFVSPGKREGLHCGLAGKPPYCFLSLPRIHAPNSAQTGFRCESQGRAPPPAAGLSRETADCPLCDCPLCDCPLRHISRYLSNTSELPSSGPPLPWPKLDPGRRRPPGCCPRVSVGFVSQYRISDPALPASPPPKQQRLVFPPPPKVSRLFVR